MCSLEAVEVHKAYAEVKVLSGLSLSIETGSFEALMGPSGCGKSTFLNLAAGLLGCDAGEIKVGGFAVSAMSDSRAARFRRRHIGVIFQDFNLLDTLTVRENIALPVRLDHGRIDETRLAYLVSRLGLEGKENRRAAALSGGERQRVAIARALFAKPDIVLADEPTGNLDVANAREICDLLAAVNREEKTAILLVTHDPVVAARADNVHFLKGGKIESSFNTEHDAALVAAKYLEVYK